LEFVFDEENEVTGALMIIVGETVIRGEKIDN
jgi:hypothetical protein